MKKLAAASIPIQMDVFHETQNVCIALQAFGLPKQPNSRQCNVTAWSNSRLIHLCEAQGCIFDAKDKGGEIQKLNSVHGRWDHVPAIVSG